MNKGRWFKLFCIAIYAAIVAGISGLVHVRTAPHTIAAHKIEKNEFIVDSDLRSADQSRISGRYATRAFQANETIAPDDTSQTPVPLPPNTVAGVISVPRPLLRGVLRPDAVMQVCLDRKPFGDPVKILASACDRIGCVVTVPLRAWPKDEALPTIPGRLSAVLAGEACDRDADAGHLIAP